MSADIINFSGSSATVAVSDPCQSSSFSQDETRFRANLDAVQREIDDLKIMTELSLLSAEAMVDGDLDRMIVIRNIIAARLNLRRRETMTATWMRPDCY